MAPVIVSHTVIYLYSISGFQLISETALTDVKYHGFLFIMHFKTAEVQVGHGKIVLHFVGIQQ